jgi:PLP dependent protein
MSVADNLRRVQADIASCALAAGRDPQEILLVAVSKTHPVALVQEALAAGLTAFGENRVQEMTEKQPNAPGAAWHLVGQLQTNKVKYIASFVAMVHSIDSLKLLEELNRRAALAGRIIQGLVQVNISDEDQKNGVPAEDAAALLAQVGGYPNVKVAGLMGMASFSDDKALVRRQFRSLRELRDRLRLETLPGNVQLEHLSMGMSGDYPIAIEEGATIIRVGSAIFGAR